jgi:hypothetical protein
MKRIINNGLPPYHPIPTAMQQQVDYINTCVDLGRYYERLFDSGRLKTMKPAVNYYEMVSALNVSEESIGRNEEAIGIKDNVCRKLAYLYYKAKGVEKDKVLSLQLAWRGRISDPVYTDILSRRYFSSNEPVFKMYKEINLNSDTSYTSFLNPFYWINVSLKSADKDELKILAEQLKRREGATLHIYGCTGFIYSGMTVTVNINEKLMAIRTYLVEKCGISPEIIETELLTEPCGKYKGYEIPCIKIEVNHLPPMRHVK